MPNENFLHVSARLVGPLADRCKKSVEDGGYQISEFVRICIREKLESDELNPKSKPLKREKIDLEDWDF